MVLCAKEKLGVPVYSVISFGTLTIGIGFGGGAGTTRQ